ncbi:hypothetical protein EYF80_049892 [Liparis tanakae]|uniref:Uncharacterized protein n=1 Tax=Liparis tanakae TaxID=230148 RepID=A0A4Z2FGC0_9TELE|nr:hypothetical protein EYF80_049892 [Liparis tanakae]
MDVWVPTQHRRETGYSLDADWSVGFEDGEAARSDEGDGVTLPCERLKVIRSSISSPPPPRHLRPGGTKIKSFSTESSSRVFGPDPSASSGFGAGVGAVGQVVAAGAVVHPLVEAAAACVHEEVADRGQLQAQLLGDGDLQLFGRTLVLLEDGVERPPLHVGEHQARLLGHAAPLAAAVVLLLTLACCGERDGGGVSLEVCMLLDAVVLRTSVRLRNNVLSARENNHNNMEVQ